MEAVENEYGLLDGALEGEILHDGKYKVVRKLAKGGMAWVYEAQDQTSGQVVALKILYAHLTKEAIMRERFLREATIQRNTLEHPNIVRVLDVIEERGLLGFTMEWCDSGDLRAWQRAYNAPLHPDHLKAFFLPLLDAIASAHRKEIVHRDLKPQNILLHSHGDVLLPKIADFGVAKILSGQSSTKTGSLMGTVAYMAPEQMEDSKSVDHRADIYSLGVIIYLMATSRLPFTGEGPQALIKILYEDPAPPTEAPPALQKVLLKCLSKRPEGRYSTCEDLKLAFEEALGGPAPHRRTASLSKRLNPDEEAPPVPDTPNDPSMSGAIEPQAAPRLEPILIDIMQPSHDDEFYSQPTELMGPEDRPALPDAPDTLKQSQNHRKIDEKEELTHARADEVNKRKRKRRNTQLLLLLIAVLAGLGAIIGIIFHIRA